GPRTDNDPATCRRWLATPQGLGGLGWGPPSSVTRWNSTRRPNSVSRALAWAMRVPSRLEASTTQADRGDPQLSTTLTGTTPRPVHDHRHAGCRDRRAGSSLGGSALGGSWHSDFGGAYLGQPLFGVVAAHDSKQPALGVGTTIARE